MLKPVMTYMDSKIAMFSIFTLTVILTMGLTVDTAVAQTSASVDGGEEYKDGSHEGKSCPSKDKKTASVDVGLNI
ncbi:hypothetical protein [Nitrosopumilus adriaticus]|uniref:Uncharacterized protein n=1 Tax=Nitrosopumilus adriaticus TaxID=1580092 RepID=A0A0D5C1N8_9ARCH|nr:hypothetical protein [Nitrosopumilus adriaticus]AJW70292.1 conserved exported protein of unknown function [Nitrosopumilus adriaticus]